MQESLAWQEHHNPGHQLGKRLVMDMAPPTGQRVCCHKALLHEEIARLVTRQRSLPRTDCMPQGGKHHEKEGSLCNMARALSLYAICAVTADANAVQKHPPLQLLNQY